MASYDAEVRVNTKINLAEFKKLNSEVEKLQKKANSLESRSVMNSKLGIKDEAKSQQRLALEYAKTEEALERAKEKLWDFNETHELTGLNSIQAQEKLKEMGKVSESTFERMKENLKSSDGLFKRLSKRIKGLALRVFVFALITKAFRSMVAGMQEGFKNLAQYSEEYNKTMSDFKSQTEQLKNSMASAFAPIVNTIVPYLTKLVSWLNIAMDTLAQFFAYLQGKNVYAKATKQVLDYAKGLGTANKEAQKLASFDDINVLDKNESGSGSGALTGADAFEEGLVDESRFEWVNWLKDNLNDILVIVGAVAVGLLAWKISAVLLGGITVLGGAIALLLAGIVLVSYALIQWAKNGEITNTQLGILVGGLLLIGVAISLITGTWIPLLIASVIGLIAIIVARGDEIKEKIREVIDNFVGKLQELKDNMYEKIGVLAIPFANLITNIQKKLTLLKGIVSGTITFIQSLFKGLFKVLKGIFTGDGQMVLDGFKTIFHGWVNSLITMAEGFINAVIRGINGLIEKVNSFGLDLPDFLGGEHIGVSINKISEVTLRRLATGGIVNRPTTALIGEAGREAVIPLENNTEWMDMLAERIGSGNVTIKFDGSLSQLARVLNPVLDAEKSRIGTTLVIN